MFSFQGQGDFNDSNPSDFQSAIEEPFLVENGFIKKLIEESSYFSYYPHFPLF